jgi:chloride channel protein, CIC family
LQGLLSKYRQSLTHYESIPSYAVLGIVGGLASGLGILGFEWAIIRLAQLWGVGSAGENFEALPPWALFVLPAAGAALLGLGFSLLKTEDREVGIVHVISRMHSHYGMLPWRNALVQFFGGAFALATGQSGGREGPGVHLGGAINSLLGQKLGLPNNSLRVLIACGTAGGIAAAFHTPLAGVIFAMEVIVAEYTAFGFIPVMLAAVSATAISRSLGGGAVLFSIPAVELNSMLEIPLIITLGLCCGVGVAAFIKISKLATHLAHWPIVVRFTLAGMLTGSLALLAPQVLGIGYDTLNLALQGKLALGVLLTIAGCKIVATSFSLGVGMPIGVIGPNLLIGACIGGTLGATWQVLMPGLASDPILYVVVGMAAAMSAVLNAPLAAILAIVELTHNVNIGMPALLAIIAANFTNGELFHQRSAHQAVLLQLKRLVPDDPVNQLLHRTDVTAGLEVDVVDVPVLLDQERADSLSSSVPGWCLIERNGDSLYLVAGQDLAAWLADNPPGEEPSDLTEAGIRRWTVAPVPATATLHQALDTMRAETTEAVCVYQRGSGGTQVLQGIVRRETVEKFSLASVV